MSSIPPDDVNDVMLNTGLYPVDEVVAEHLYMLLIFVTSDFEKPSLWPITSLCYVVKSKNINQTFIDIIKYLRKRLDSQTLHLKLIFFPMCLFAELMLPYLRHYRRLAVNGERSC